ncbi:MAG: sugar transferase [Gemmatimonadaceae bacterium]
MTPPVPILLDAVPPFMRGDGTRGSLLQLPSGDSTVLDEIVASLAKVTTRQPLVFPLFEPSDVYARHIADRCPGVGGLLRRDVFRDPLSRFEVSDVLLFISTSTYSAKELDLSELIPQSDVDGPMVRHLLAFETSLLGTKEFVHSGADGQVQRIQRYYEPRTWPFTAGVIASLVHVANIMTAANFEFASLDELRQRLSAAGVPSQDVPFRGQVFDLLDEAGVLALQERRVLSLLEDRPTSSTRYRGAAFIAHGATVAESARLVGPVVVASGAVIADDALVVGPTVIGANALVGEGAIVAQCLLMPSAEVKPQATVRHRVVAHDDDGAGNARNATPHRRHAFVAQSDAPPVPPERGYLRIKTIVEPILAFFALGLLAPLFVVIAILVKLTSRGGIFYADKREGKDGKEFLCWKFRSMRMNAHAMQATLAKQQIADGPQFKMVNDPRLTPIGGKLRALNLDELPQLFNVLLGEMSFVGPRPSPFRENQICVPWRQGRLSVRPGITGLWQVCRKDRAAGDFHQWIFYDLVYVRRVSFLVDLKIFVATILTHGGRYPVRLEKIINDVGSIEPEEKIAREFVPPVPLRGRPSGAPSSQAFAQLEPAEFPANTQW